MEVLLRGVAAQKFQHGRRSRFRKLIRPTFGLIGVCALAGAITETVTYFAVGTALGVGLAVVIVMWYLLTKPSREQQCHYWLSTAFSGGAVAALTGPALILVPSIISVVLGAVAATLALMASLTGFCAGRLLYVLLFRIDERTGTACD